jgi:hypothetical protein
MIVYCAGIIDHWSGWQKPEQVFRLWATGRVRLEEFGKPSDGKKRLIETKRKHNLRPIPPISLAGAAYTDAPAGREREIAPPNGDPAMPIDEQSAT